MVVASPPSTVLPTTVAIIGAGWSGLYALKYCLEEGLSATAFEERPNRMGVWRMAERQGAVASSSKSWMHPSDVPFPAEMGDFPAARDINRHMEKYCDHFGLNKHIMCGVRVTNVKWNEGR
mmetsp:Transcript_19021/g.23580  ORF Transcript_19021/g.23580 Transcript_19021/m.23580 type:complete len:121 (+) Transcript_19021:216-578(+)